MRLLIVDRYKNYGVYHYDYMCVYWKTYRNFCCGSELYDSFIMYSVSLFFVVLGFDL